jgi:hypothetical protein
MPTFPKTYRDTTGFGKAQHGNSLLEMTGWDKNCLPPPLPLDVVEQAGKRYREAYERLTAKAL